MIPSNNIYSLITPLDVCVCVCVCVMTQIVLMYDWYAIESFYFYV